jgi:ribosome-binding protein aMBF1 (putative translation factor)
MEQKFCQYCGKLKHRLVNNFGVTIARIRKNNWMSQSALSIATNIPEKNIRAMENGELRPTIEELSSITKVLHTTPFAVLGKVLDRSIAKLKDARG